MTRHKDKYTIAGLSRFGWSIIAMCRSCGHAGTPVIGAVATRLDLWNRSADALEPYLRCMSCGVRDAEVVAVMTLRFRKQREAYGGEPRETPPHFLGKKPTIPKLAYEPPT